MAAFQRAAVVMIPEKAATLNYTLTISLANNGEYHDSYTYTHSDLSHLASAGEITEIDVSWIFPQTLLVPGETYVTVNFVSDTNQTNVLGLLFQYEGVGGTGNGGPMGPAGPQGLAGADGAAGVDGATGALGPQGPAGPVGPQGPQGPEGPQGPAGADGADGVAGTVGAAGQPKNSHCGPISTIMEIGA